MILAMVMKILVLIQPSVMGNSLAIAARYTTTHVYSAKEKLPKPKYILEGESMNQIFPRAYPKPTANRYFTQIRRNARIPSFPGCKSPPETLQVLHQQRRLPRRSPRRSPRRPPPNTRNSRPARTDQTSRRKRRRARRGLRGSTVPTTAINIHRMQRNSRALSRANNTPRALTNPLSPIMLNPNPHLRTQPRQHQHQHKLAMGSPARPPDKLQLPGRRVSRPNGAAATLVLERARYGR